MEKMGWQKGKGLGANEDGMTENIKVRIKSDTKGIGFKNEYDNVWLDHQDEFENLLSNLSQNSANSSNRNDKVEEVKSLEERSKETKRLHYKKFAKSKDLSSVSANDLNCILGTQKRKLKASEESSKNSNSDTEDLDSFRPSFSQVKTEKIENDSEKKIEDNIGVKFNTNKLSVQDYFANKMASKNSSMKKNLNESSNGSDYKDSNGESEQKYEEHVEEENFVKKKKKKKNKEKDFELEKTNEEVEDLENIGKKNKIEMPVNLVELQNNEENVSDDRIKNKKKKKSKKVIESEGFSVSITQENIISPVDDVSKELNEIDKTNLKKLNEDEFDENIEKKKKKKSKTKDEELNVSLNEERNNKPNDLDSLVKSSFKGSNLLSIYGYSAYYINSNLEEAINEKVKRLNRKRYLVNKKLEIDAEYYKMNKKMNV